MGAECDRSGTSDAVASRLWRVRSAVPHPYELRLGVTGHRDLRDERAIARAIERLTHRIDHTLNHQAAAPLSWTVVSALPRGADRLCGGPIHGPASHNQPS